MKKNVFFFPNFFNDIKDIKTNEKLIYKIKQDFISIQFITIIQDYNNCEKSEKQCNKSIKA